MSVLCLGQFRSKDLEKPLPVRKLLKEAIKNPENGYDPQTHPPATVVLEKYTEKVISMAETLGNYFGIDITDSHVVALPVIHEQFVYIRREDIGNLLLRICSEVGLNSLINQLKPFM